VGLLRSCMASNLSAQCPAQPVDGHGKLVDMNDNGSRERRKPVKQS